MHEQQLASCCRANPETAQVTFGLEAPRVRVIVCPTTGWWQETDKYFDCLLEEYILKEYVQFRSHLSKADRRIGIHFVSAICHGHHLSWSGNAPFVRSFQ